MKVLCYVPLRPLCRLTKYTVVGTALSPALTVGMLAIDPVDSQVLFSPGHWHRSTEVMSQDCSSRHLDPMCELWRQLGLWSGPTPKFMCPQSPQLLKPDPSQLQQHLLSFQMFQMC